jgi:hypothetical protein
VADGASPSRAAATRNFVACLFTVNQTTFYSAADAIGGVIAGQIQSAADIAAAAQDVAHRRDAMRAAAVAAQAAAPVVARERLN